MDYPGLADWEVRPPNQRRFPTLDRAVERAIEIFRQDLTLPKVVVCDTDTHRRLVTVYGDRTAPTVTHRAPLI